LPLIERLDLLTKEGIYVSLKGRITQGDHATLAKIHSLMPVHTLVISSPRWFSARGAQDCRVCQ
jgi:hypothetical protein